MPDASFDSARSCPTAVSPTPLNLPELRLRQLLEGATQRRQALLAFIAQLVATSLTDAPEPPEREPLYVEESLRSQETL